MSAGFENSVESEDLELARRVKLFLAHQPRPALRYLRVEAQGSTVTLRGLVHNRRIPHIRIGPRLVVFDLDDLDAWMAEHRIAAIGGTP